MSSDSDVQEFEPPKKVPKLTSWVWQYGEKFVDGKSAVKFKCNVMIKGSRKNNGSEECWPDRICKSICSAKDGNTTGAAKHLLKDHFIKPPKEKGLTISVAKSKSLKSKRFFDPKKVQLSLDQSVAVAISSKLLPFDIMESPVMINLMDSYCNAKIAGDSMHFSAKHIQTNVRSMATQYVKYLSLTFREGVFMSLVFVRADLQKTTST